MSVLEEIEEMIERKGSELYGSEAVTQRQHALQCAALAERDSAPPALIAAALLHDIGHLLDKDFEAALDRDEDRFHENLGKVYLSRHFGPEVTEPVRMHVDAKRYLCAIDPDYNAKLSPGLSSHAPHPGWPDERGRGGCVYQPALRQ